MKNYRDDFNMANEKYIYFNSASTALKPKVVLEEISNYYNHYSVNTNRGVDSLGYLVTTKVEKVRNQIASYINAEIDEIIFDRGTTEGLNIVANGLADFINEGDEIIVTIAEHHANFVPWFEIAKNKKAKLIILEIDDLYTNLEKKLSEKTKIVAINHISNVLGIKNDLEKISKIVRKTNAYLVVDGAQGIVHEKIDVKKLDIDFYAFSGHKLYGPMGVGVLFGKSNLLNKIKPLLYGGEMIDIVTKESVTYKKAPYKFEGGTMMIPEILALGKAIEYIEEIGLNNINNHIMELRSYLITEMSNIPNIIIYNTNQKESNLITFNIKGIHSHDVATVLDKNNIIIRAGHHCAAPLHEYLKTDSTLRISLGLYNTLEECEMLIKTLKKAGDYINVLFE